MMMDKRRGEQQLAALVVIITVLGLIGVCRAGSCRAAQLCCHGRDSGCVVQKASPNAIIETPRDKPCYCDHACLKLADCCDDFNETCAVTDCELGGWSEWSECDNRCGAGRRTRSRPVLRPERNGGKPCQGDTQETSDCQNFDGCRRRARHFQLVLESTTTATEEEEAEGYDDDDSSDSDDDDTGAGTLVSQVTRGYCANFVLLKVSGGCHRSVDFLQEGSRVCVRCGEGSCRLDNSLHAGIARWELLSPSRQSTGCHGKWLVEPDSWTKCSASCQGPRLAFV